MINTGLADNIIETFGFRKPTRPEKHEFQTALKNGEPPIPEATKAQEMAALANLIKAKLGPRFQTIHNSKPRVQPPSRRDPIRKLSQDLVKFKNYLSEAIEQLQKIDTKSKNDLDKVGKGVRTSLAIIALLLKTIISRLDKVEQFTKANFDKFLKQA